jgi:uncharacterized membrane protein
MNALEDLNISVSGVNAEFLAINPSEIKRIEGYGKEKVKVIITAPAYFGLKNYPPASEASERSELA